MNKQKQTYNIEEIIEMAKILQAGELSRNAGTLDCSEFTTDIIIRLGLQRLAGCKALYREGYHKQRKGIWNFHDDGSGTCDQCKTTQKNVWDMDNYQSYCGHCGAKMKGGAE